MNSASEFLNSDAPTISATQYLTDEVPQDKVAQAPSGFMQGLRDPMDAGAQMLAHAFPGISEKFNKLGASIPGGSAIGLDRNTPQQIDSDIQAREKDYQGQRSGAGESGIDWGRLGGNITGTLPLAFATPEMSGASLLAKIGIGAGQGAATGLLQPVIEGNFGDEKIKQAEIGGVAGGIMGPLASGIARIISPKTAPEVKELIDSGVKLTPGQILGGGWKATEDKLSSIPFLGDMIKTAQSRAAGDLNKSVANDALSHIGEKASSAPGRELVQEVSDKLGAAYDDVLPKLSFKPDPIFASEIKKTADMATFLPKDQAKQFKSIVGEQLKKLRNGGDGETLKGAMSELKRQAKGYLSDNSFDNRKLGDAIGEVVSSVKNNLQRSNPAYAERLADIDRGYAKYTILRKAATNLGQSGEPGLFSPSQLQAAVRSADKSVAKGNFARGNALMQDTSDAALKVIGGKYPDSGTPGRAAIAALGAGAGGFLHPAIPIAALAGSLPYTKAGQSVMQKMMTSRPGFAEPVANALERSLPWLAPLAPFSLNGGK